MARTLTALVEPEVLHWARESIGLTPLAAARKIGLSDETLVDQWEAGAAAPSIPQLREAARVYKSLLENLCGGRAHRDVPGRSGVSLTEAQGGPW